MTLTDITPEAIITALETMAEYGEPPQANTSVFDVGSDHYLSFFVEEICDHLVAGGGSTCRFFEGPYGAGKTTCSNYWKSGLGLGYAVVRTDCHQTSTWRTGKPSPICSKGYAG